MKTGQLTEPARLKPTKRAALAQLVPAKPVQFEGGQSPDASELILRPLEESDRMAFIQLIAKSKNHLDPWFPLHHANETNEQLFERFLALTIRTNADGSACRRIGCLPDGQLVGGFNLINVVRGLEVCADANWWISPGHTGQGYATMGVSTMIRYALADLPAGLGLHKVNAWIIRGNDPSIRLAHRVGLIRAGEEHSYLQTGSRWEIHDLYTISVMDIDQ